MSKWFMFSRTMWANVAMGGLFAAGLPVALELDSPAAMQAVGILGPGANGFVRFGTTQALGRHGKRVLQSKTVKLNAVILIAAALAFVAGAPEVAFALVGIALVNLALRKVTTTGVTVAPHPFRH